MKFSIKHVNHGARVGYLSEIGRRSESFETPLLLHYTRGANLPHITREVFEMLTNEPQALSISLVNTMTFLSPMEEYSNGITQFAAMGDCLSYISFQDTGILSTEKFQDKNSIPLWTRHGKVLVDPTKYIGVMEKFKPDIYHTLCDSDTGPESTEKHLTRAVIKSNEMFSKCMELHVDNKWLTNNSFVLGAITGGYSKDHREKSIKNILESKYLSSLGGILIEGLKANGPFNENVNNEKLFEIVDYVVSKVPGSLMRSVSGCFSPLIILRLVSQGIDIFDSSYAYITTERNCAFNFGFTNEMDNRKAAEINLADDKYKEDFSPILEKCSCLTCTKHTKAYINHLIATRELLGPVLLALHNSHHFIEFFKAIRKAIAENRLQELGESIEAQYKHNTYL